ncbi:hypothetical protein [Streptomyces niphimycinicus]|uniref:hypothetical protein n=1 Tax=Streptomyces niphimycinicus TaxID=2842201 RepID=UPI00209A6FAA|nr:hypothetical protein [Streptomyces niphimycinicus]
MTPDQGPFPDSARLRRHVEFLAAGPRGRRRALRAMRRAEVYVHDELTAAGRVVQRRPFDVRRQIGSTDRYGHRALALKPRLHRRPRGANLIASLPRSGPMCAPPESDAPATGRPLGVPAPWERGGCGAGGELWTGLAPVPFLS